MAFNSYISLIKGKLGAKTGEVAIEQAHAGPQGQHASITRPAADGLGLDVVSGAQDGSGTDTANLGDTATHERGITTEVEPVELRADAGSYNLGDTATHERGTGGNAHSIFTEFTFPTEQVSSEHGGMATTDETPPLGDSDRVLAAQGSGSDEQVVGVTEYGTTDLGHTGGVFTFKSTSGMDSETERLSFSSDRGGGPSGGVQKFDGPGAWSAEGVHAANETLGINDQTPADWNERSAAGHELKTEWITSAVGGPGAPGGEAVQDVFVTELVARPEAESNVSVFGVGGGVDDARATDLRVSHNDGQGQGSTVRFDGGLAPHDGGHDVKWEGPDYDATRSFAQPGHEGLVMPFVEQNQVVEPHGEAAAMLPYMEAQNVVDADEPTLDRQGPASDDASVHTESSASIDAVHQATTGSALDAGFTLNDDLVNSVSSLDSDADAPTTLLGDLGHADHVYTGVNDGSLLGVHDGADHVLGMHHELPDASGHGHDAALDHLHHIDIDLDL